MKEVGFLVVFGKCLIPFEEEQGCTRINIFISLGPYILHGFSKTLQKGKVKRIAIETLMLEKG